MLTKKKKTLLKNNRPFAIWFTGLSGAGKSTLAQSLRDKLATINNVVILDGDVLRRGVCAGLAFSQEDREENIRRTAELTKMLLDQQFVVLSALITPLDSQRDLVKKIVDGHDINIVWVKCPLDVCESRDVKGLYKKARGQQIGNFTGIGSLFEDPKDVDLSITTDSQSIAESTDVIIDYLIKKDLIKKSNT